MLQHFDIIESAERHWSLNATYSQSKSYTDFKNNYIWTQVVVRKLERNRPYEHLSKDGKVISNCILSK
jgi:hypothetical protein